MTTVGFAIPTVGPRTRLLERAVRSVIRQTHPIAQISVVSDIEQLGAGPTRNKALNALTTEWTCFLDDDDEVRPTHVADLLAHQAETGTDVVYPWFDVAGGTDPFPQFEGLDWDPEHPRIFPITVLVRTELAQQASFPAPGEIADWAGDDWPYWLRVQEMGGTISHLPKRTWIWHHHDRNTSGLPSRVR